MCLIHKKCVSHAGNDGFLYTVQENWVLNYNKEAEAQFAAIMLLKLGP